MRRIYAVFACSILACSLVGCKSMKYIVKLGAKANNNQAVTSLPAYSGPQARVVVADFEVQASKANTEIAAGLRQMLITALTDSGRFSLLDPQQISLSGQGAVGSSPAKNNKDLIITAALTEFEPQVSGGRAGLGGGGGVGSGLLGGLLGSSLNKAHLALDIRIVDVATSEVLAQTLLQGQAAETSGNILNGLALAGGLATYANTPMEKAIRICISEAVRYISGAVPANYYTNGKT